MLTAAPHIEAGSKELSWLMALCHRNGASLSSGRHLYGTLRALRRWAQAATRPRRGWEWPSDCVLRVFYTSYAWKKKKGGALSVDRWLIKVKKDSKKHFRRTWEQLALMFSVSRELEAILFGHPSPECLQGCQGVETSRGEGGVGGFICRIYTFKEKKKNQLIRTRVCALFCEWSWRIQEKTEINWSWILSFFLLNACENWRKLKLKLQLSK